MTDHTIAIEKLRDDLTANPDIIDQIMVHNFDFQSFIDGAEALGYNTSEDAIETYLSEQYPSTSSEAKAKYYRADNKRGEFRELTSKELETVSGGTTFAAAFVAVAVAALVLVAAVVVINAFAVTNIGGGGGEPEPEPEPDPDPLPEPTPEPEPGV